MWESIIGTNTRKMKSNNGSLQHSIVQNTLEKNVQKLFTKKSNKMKSIVLNNQNLRLFKFLTNKNQNNENVYSVTLNKHEFNVQMQYDSQMSKILKRKNFESNICEHNGFIEFKKIIGHIKINFVLT